jgi:competence protein ComEA
MRKIVVFRTIGVLVILALSILILVLFRSKEMDKTVILIGESQEETPERTEHSLSETTQVPFIYVYITGAVQEPGVYALREGARLYQAVSLAGGLLPEADLSRINEAAILKDSEHVHVPLIGETLPASSEDPGSVTVNINTEGPDRLMLLPGIGEAKAAAIVRYRTQYGPFSSIEDIMNVSGIGKALFEQIKDRIKV